MNNKVTQEKINALLNSAETEEYTFHGKQHVVSYRFPNGFAIIGVGSCVDPANFDIELGRKYAREQVENRLWELEGYLLQEDLFRSECHERSLNRLFPKQTNGGDR